MFGEFISDDLDRCDISPASGYEAVRAQYTEQGPDYDARIVSVTISLGSSGRANCKAFNALNEPSLHLTGCGLSTAGVILAVAKKR